MDFLTGLAFWGILVLVIVNAIFVSRLEIQIDPHDDEEDA